MKLGNPRVWLAGPLALIVAIVAMAAMSLWFPPGAAKLNNLVFPLILFPLLWAAAFFYAVLESDVRRCAVVLGALLIVNGAAVAASIAGLLN